MKIYITGDVHGDIDMRKFNTSQFPYKTKKDDIVIVTGDMGVCWNERKDRFIRKWFDEKPWTTVFCDGNHENFEILNNFPVEEWNGGKVHKINESLIHLMRGEIYNIDNKTYFVMGGAFSHDKQFRKPYVSWWPEELPSNDELKHAEKNLKQVNYKVDYIISHCCSSSIQSEIDETFKTDHLTDWFDFIEDNVMFEKWYFGHYHIDHTVDKSHICLYDEIIPIGANPYKK
ncbi:metallophosphoesterase [bacterium]|nr:metallophosphoesterase [bacterium]